MGAGRGASRRVSSQAKVYADRGSWDEFVAGNGIAGTSLRDYYGADADLTEIASNVLADLVVIGAVKLPDGFAADDFDFYIAGMSGPPILVMSDKSDGESMVMMTTAALESNPNMGSRKLREFIDNIVHGFWSIQYQREQRGEPAWPAVKASLSA